jgi:hypothetical protein
MTLPAWPGLFGVRKWLERASGADRSLRQAMLFTRIPNGDTEPDRNLGCPRTVQAGHSVVVQASLDAVVVVAPENVLYFSGTTIHTQLRIRRRRAVVSPDWCNSAGAVNENGHRVDPLRFGPIFDISGRRRTDDHRTY